MANAQLLEEFRKSSGKTKTHLAQALKVSRPSLYKMMKNPETCTVTVAHRLCEELNIEEVTDREEIFLA